MEVLANFASDKYGLDCGLELKTKVFQLSLDNVSGNLKGMITRVTSFCITGEACGVCWSATLELVTGIILLTIIFRHELSDIFSLDDWLNIGDGCLSCDHFHRGDILDS